MNMAANMLGLDNAATPIGIKAMKELQELNPDKETASNAQILFLVINASSITLLPVTIFTYRAQLGALDPTDVFIPILMATYCSTRGGFAFVAMVQRIRLDAVVLAWIGGLTLAVAAIALYFASLAEAEMARSALVSNFLLLAIIAAFLVGALVKGVNAYEAFIDGAKEGFHTAVTIIPYLVAMLVAIGMLRASGALPAFVDLVRGVVLPLGFEHMSPGALGAVFQDRPSPFDRFDAATEELVGRADIPQALRYFGGAGREHMQKYGTRLETFAKIGAKASRHAANNPLALLRGGLTVEDVMNAKAVWPGVMTG